MSSSATGGQRCGRWLAVLLLPAALGCRPSAAPNETLGKTPVTVSISPQAYFVSRVGGEHVDVQVLVRAGQSPHTYEPTPKQMARLARSRIYFRVGVQFEEQLFARMGGTFANLEVVDTRQGIKLRSMSGAQQCQHDDRDGHDHAHDDDSAAAGAEGTPDPHTWLSPKLAKIQARTICSALKRIDPAHGDEFDRNLRAFEKDLDAVDAEIGELLRPLEGQSFFVFHPAFGYFGDAFGLEQIAVETGGQEPGPKQLAALIDHAKKAGVRLIFVQRQFSSGSAEAVAEAIGGAVVPLDPLAEDYIANLRDMARHIAKGLRQQHNHRKPAVTGGE
ncbi:MAG: zinc ABC transporter substrate-binding protein [Planctomycetota bacterium]